MFSALKAKLADVNVLDTEQDLARTDETPE